jgi:hypothetical protein
MPLPETARTSGDNGYPAWIAGLQCEEPNHTVLVVRDLDPDSALQLLGVPPEEIRPCELPAERPDESTSLPRAAFDTEDDTGAVLLAGRIGDWTFIYDDGGITTPDPVAGRAAGRRHLRQPADSAAPRGSGTSEARIAPSCDPCPRCGPASLLG